MKKWIPYLFVVSFIVSIFFQRWLELHHKVDSIGLWYTAYCAFFYSIILTFVGLLLIICVRKLFLKKP
jgi:hypothetical protein